MLKTGYSTDGYFGEYIEDMNWEENTDGDSRICPACNGSGEGQADGTVCGECGVVVKVDYLINFVGNPKSS